MSSETSWVLIDGLLLSEEEASVPLSDRGLLFGEGLFTTIRLSEGTPEHLGDHLLRLKESAEALGIGFEPPSSEALFQLIKKNSAFSGVWRLKILITGGDAPGHKARRGRVLATLSPYLEEGGQPLRLSSYPEPLERPSARMKTLSYLDRFLVKQWAALQGADDALTRDSKENLLEASFSNLFWVLGRTLFTPSPKLPLLFGIGLKQVLKEAEKRGLSVEFVEAKEIPEKAFVYLVNSMTLSRPVLEWKGRSFPLKSWNQS